MNSLEKIFARVFTEWLPGLPPSVKDRAARVLPWVIIVLGTLGLLAWMGATGLLGPAAKTAGISRTCPAFAAALLNILIPGLQLIAIAGGCYMLQRRRLGWRLAFYALLIGLIIDLFLLSPAGIVWDVVFAYLLFQLKPYYSKG